jgi:hypothetical protein
MTQNKPETLTIVENCKGFSFNFYFTSQVFRILALLKKNNAIKPTNLLALYDKIHFTVFVKNQLIIKKFRINESLV